MLKVKKFWMILVGENAHVGSFAGDQQCGLVLFPAK